VSRFSVDETHVTLLKSAASLCFWSRRRAISQDCTVGRAALPGSERGAKNSPF
jgi:hypothetical protein